MKHVTVPAFAATFVAGGGRDIDTTRTPELAALAQGEHVRLVDDRDEEVGLAIADPENARLRVMVLPSDGLTKVDGTLLALRVERAVAWRKQLGLTGAYRLIHGAGDGLPGFTCDVLGDVAVIWVLGEGLRGLGKQLADAVIGFGKLAGAVVKLRARGGAETVEQDVIGAVGDKHLADEAGLSFEIHALSGLNTGLFTDMREQRRGLPRFAAGARVLNLFSYTGALGLACARGGADRVTNVDTSQGVKAWAAGNFARAGFTGDRYRFEQGDAIRYLARAQKDKETYDLIVIDPPTFSPARGSPWVLDRDYPNLIGQAASVTREGGILWLAANTHDLQSLAKLAAKGIRSVNRTAQVIEQGSLPPEYPTVVAQPGDRYLQICAL
ncbi:MAG TPA: class I SAM-dependent methyltransferase, partial [Kofleriaceae bacterium]